MWSPAGLLAVARGRTLSVLDARNLGTISRALCFTPFESETTTVSSRTGGTTLFHFLTASVSRKLAIYDARKFQLIGGTSLSEFHRLGPSYHIVLSLLRIVTLS